MSSCHRILAQLNPELIKLKGIGDPTLMWSQAAESCSDLFWGEADGTEFESGDRRRRRRVREREG